MRVARARADGTLGAAAGLIVAAAFGAFGVYVGGDVPSVGLPVVIGVTLVVAVAPGWIVGVHLGSTFRSTLLGIVAYALVAWALWIPIAVVGSTWASVRAGVLVEPLDILGAMGAQLAYAAAASLVLWMLALPFAFVWIVSYRTIGRLVHA